MRYRSVFRRFSTRYLGICHFFLRYCGIGYPAMSPSMITFRASLLTKMNVIRCGKHTKTINELNNHFFTTFHYNATVKCRKADLVFFLMLRDNSISKLFSSVCIQMYLILYLHERAVQLSNALSLFLTFYY